MGMLYFQVCCETEKVDAQYHLSKNEKNRRQRPNQWKVTANNVSANRKGLQKHQMQITVCLRILMELDVTL